MTAISVKGFGGIKPIVSARLLQPSEAQEALNARLVSGSLRPMKLPTTLKATVTANPATIFRYGDSATETDYWLEFSQDTDVMRSPIANDQYDRLYWTDGNNVPRYAPNSLILQAGSGAYPRASYQLGIPAPTTAPTITAFSAVVNYTTVTREYVMTFYNPTAAKESQPGSIFSVLGVDGQKVAFSSITTNNLGDAGVTKKRIYRKVSGTYRRIAELDLSVTTYDDTATDASLAAAPALASALASAPVASNRAPTVTAEAATTTAAGVSRQYVYTIKNYSTGSGDGTQYFSESLASSAVTVTADETQTVTIGNLNNSLVGTHFRVYRKDPSMSAYRLVAEVPVSQTSVQDNISSTTLGITLAPDGGSQPSTTPTASANSSTATSSVKRIYMITHLDASNNESGKSPASSIVTVVDGQTTVTILHSDTVPSGVTKKRIYRQTVTYTGTTLNTSDANWKIVAEVTASTTSYTDKVADASLGAALASGLRDLPPTPISVPASNATIPPKQVPESRTYVYTYVSAYGEEGPPSSASDVTDVDPTKSVTLSSGGAPGGNNNITLKRIYRSSTVGASAQFQFVAEIPVGQSSYTDNKEQADLGEILPSEDWVAPPAGLKGLRLMANGAAVGFVGKALYFSEPNLPHAWPHQYPIDYDIVGIGVFGQSVAVITKGYPYLFQGIDPAAMASTKLELPQAGANKRSIVETADGVVYSSPDGLVSIGASVGIVSQNLFSREQWQSFNPSSMETYLYNNKVHCLWNNGTTRGTLVFDLSGQGAVLTTNDINVSASVTAGYYDAKKDVLYLVRSNNILRFDDGDSAQFKWTSKVWRLPKPENMTFGQVNAIGYPLTMKVYADGVLKMTKTVPNNNQFRLPSGFRAYEWYFTLEGTSEVLSAELATSSLELQNL